MEDRLGRTIMRQTTIQIRNLDKCSNRVVRPSYQKKTHRPFQTLKKRYLRIVRYPNLMAFRT